VHEHLKCRHLRYSCTRITFCVQIICCDNHLSVQFGYARTSTNVHTPAFTVNVTNKLLYSYITPNSTSLYNSHNRLPRMYVFLSNGILQKHYLPTERTCTSSIFLFVLLNLPIDSGNSSHCHGPLNRIRNMHMHDHSISSRILTHYPW
jgi:hypothetical protein